MSEPLLSLAGARVVKSGRDRRFVLDVPRFDIWAGQTVALVAPSGRGKTTLINLLALAAPPAKVERFRLGSVDIGDLWNRKQHDVLALLRARKFGYVVQTGALLPALTARENIQLAQTISGRVDNALLDDIADRLDIANLLSDKPAALSVGERQRVAIARALAHRPALVLADEPTAALDPVNKSSVMELLLDLARTIRTALIIASHDLENLARFGIDRIEPKIHIQGSETRSTIEHVTEPTPT